MPTPTLGVMALYLQKQKLEELDFFSKLTAAGASRGIDVFVFTPEDLNEAKKQIRAWVFDRKLRRWQRQWRPLPDLVYDRCRFQRTYRFQLLRKFRTDYPGLTYLNRPLVHKWGIHQTLQKNRSIRPFLPETVMYQEPADLTKFLKKHPLVYMKPVDGTGGRGILRIEDTGKGTYLIQGRDRSRKIIPPQVVRADQLGIRLGNYHLKGQYLLQQGIPLKLGDGRVHDFRLLIQKTGSGSWSVTGCAGRIGPKRSITSNLHGGGMAIAADKLLRHRFGSEAKLADIRRTMDQLAYDVVEHVESSFGSLCEMALDLAVGPGGRVYLLEINPKPSREVFRRIGELETYRTAIRRPVEYALYLYRSKK